MECHSILDIRKPIDGISLDCPECEAAGGDGRAEDLLAFVPKASIHINNPRFGLLLQQCLWRISKAGVPIQLETRIRLQRRGTLPGVVGLTTFLVEGYSNGGSKKGPVGQHTVTFYTQLLNQLSDKAVLAVMAHELAHAWLNEHIRPEASRRREEDADLLAEMWGFGPELAQLAEEAEPLHAE
jgi:hypothetical protein